MPVLLVRHAIAVARKDWDGPDEMRPLSKRGGRQAEALVEQLAPFGMSRVLSSPSARCVATVQPLARARSLAVEEVAELGEDQAPEAARLARSCVNVEVVLCTHGDVVPVVLDALLPGEGHRTSKKGSTWALEVEAPGAAVGRYLPPPA